MIFTMIRLKKFLSCIKDKKINQINLKSNKLQIIINTEKQNKKTIEKVSTINNQKKKYNKTTEIPVKNQKNTDNTIIKINSSETYSTIVSPMVGTFYRSPAPNEPAFIEESDIVKKKQTVCIIEAMKLMNEIEAELDGEIIEILVTDGDIVDCGQALMKIKQI
uniref:Biotin carboxyl carrier protein of acetyl-CoA carboxylase n=1 Tax=Sphondylothamnion multifidum TaxID=193186 RepID=A0A4D6X516_9FLOR|nr:acetyl-CoA carboxylase, biotin carboxyl carrier protein [Sphondylothamnion multifidum]